MAGTAVLGRVTWRAAKAVAVHDETATARTLALAICDWPGHVAGQHVDVRLTAPDGYTAVRSYSIASGPNSEGRFEITVERLPGGEVSPLSHPRTRSRRSSGVTRSNRRLVRVAYSSS